MKRRVLDLINEEIQVYDYVSQTSDGVEAYNAVVSAETLKRLYQKIVELSDDYVQIPGHEMGG
jgi:hypothetical protein